MTDPLYQCYDLHLVVVADVLTSVTGPLYQCDEIDLAAVNVLYSLTAANMHSIGVIVGDDLS